jgi:ABC-type transporter Mla maintaining outer membrane lipid asymmetry ATPase subunit MlaF
VTAESSPLLELTGITKKYGALRPLRIERLTVASGTQLALVGLDRPAAEVFINLMTGATLPDRGDVRVFGRSTADITDSGDWLTTLDRFGIVSDRAPLLDAMTVVQNLALPFALEIEPPPPGVREQAVALAREAGLNEGEHDVRAGDLDPLARLCVRLARALALNPSVLLLDHPTATLEEGAGPAFARDVRRIAERRGLAAISLTMDKKFAAAAGRVLTLDPASGCLKEASWLRRLM